MQKLLLTVSCFFFPIFIFPDFNLIFQVFIVGIIYEAKVAIGLMLLSLLAGFWSIIAFFRLLFSGLRLKYCVELAIAVGICWGSYAYAKNKFKNLHQRPLRLLRGEISLIPDFQKIKNDWRQAKCSIVVFRRAIQKLRSLISRDFLQLKNSRNDKNFV
jgi:uncharacterized membrane protein (GlpM family)